MNRAESFTEAWRTDVDGAQMGERNGRCDTVRPDSSFRADRPGFGRSPAARLGRAGADRALAPVLRVLSDSKTGGGKGWAIIYDHLVDTFANCVEEHGRPCPRLRAGVHLEAPPGSWSPQTDRVDPVRAGVAEGGWSSAQHFFEEVCPILSPEDVLYGPAG